VSSPRRDHTPALRVPAKPEQASTVELSTDEFGDLVRDSAACLRETKDLAEQLRGLDEKVDALLHDRTRGQTMIAIGRWLIGLTAASIISWVAWVHAEQRSHDVRLTRGESEFANLRADVERHEGTRETTREDQTRVRGDVQAMRASLEDLRRSVDDIRTDVRELRQRRR
jgi:predicted RNase H-like nuclease (RuvC/YqgF family)